MAFVFLHFLNLYPSFASRRQGPPLAFSSSPSLHSPNLIVLFHLNHHLRGLCVTYNSIESLQGWKTSPSFERDLHEPESKTSFRLGTWQQGLFFSLVKSIGISRLSLTSPTLAIHDRSPLQQGLRPIQSRHDLQLCRAAVKVSLRDNLSNLLLLF